MGGLKFYGKDDNVLERLLRAVKTFRDSIGLEFGLNKYVKTTFQKVKYFRFSGVR